MVRVVAHRAEVRGGRFAHPRRAFRVALAVAVALHLPLTPLAGVWRWLAGLAPLRDAWEYADDDSLIPVTMVDDEPAAAPGTPGGEGAGHAIVADAGPSDAALEAEAAVDAAAEDAAPRDAGRRAKSAEGDAGADGAAGDAGAGDRPRMKDTLALAGNLKRTVDSGANVVLLMWFSAMREHRLGRVVGDILACNPQWKDFLGDALDPVRDLDAVLISGPRLSDSSRVKVVVQHRLTDAAVRDLVDGLVHRSGAAGGFVDAGAGGVVARAFADRAERVVFTHPRKLVFVTPPNAWDTIRAIKAPLSIPAGDGRALSLVLRTPWGPMRRVGIAAPSSLAWLRVDVVATDDGGANVSVEFDDESAEAATRDAPVLADALAGSTAGLVVGPVAFQATGARIEAHTHIGALKARLVLNTVRSMTCPEPPPVDPDAGAEPP